MTKQEFNKITKNKNVKELKELIIKGINEDIKMTDNQLMKLIQIKNEKELQVR